MNYPLVSIIIPTYNRAHLIGETLDSIIEQTYENWECIVVDDGSDDNTDEVLKKYCEKDSRILYHHRPVEHLSGGNGARNYGFKLSKGEYVNWFDSDDLMLSDKIMSSVQIIKGYDFVVTKSIDFSDTKDSIEIEKYNNNSLMSLNGSNFLQKKIYFRTQDLMIKKLSVLGLIFNENIRSGQEYDFFSRLLYRKNLEGIYSNLTTTKRRIHENSIQNNLLDGNRFLFGVKNYILLYNDLYRLMDKASKKYIFIELIRMNLQNQFSNISQMRLILNDLRYNRLTFRITFELFYFLYKNNLPYFKLYKFIKN